MTTEIQANGMLVPWPYELPREGDRIVGFSLPLRVLRVTWNVHSGRRIIETEVLP